MDTTTEPLWHLVTLADGRRFHFRREETARSFATHNPRSVYGGPCLPPRAKPDTHASVTLSPVANRQRLELHTDAGAPSQISAVFFFNAAEILAKLQTLDARGHRLTIEFSK